MTFLNATRLRDVDRLKETFYRHFDRSRLEVLLALGDRDLASRADLLGEGAHFRAWRIRGRSPSTMDIVFKRATAGFDRQDPLAPREWVQAMARLRGAGGLIPPFEVLETEHGVGIAMPFGDRPFAEAAAHWQPLADRLDELSVALAARGLKLADVPQGRCWSGVPFLYDLSDVRQR